MADDSTFIVELVDRVTRPARAAARSVDRLKKKFEKFQQSSLGRAVQGFASAAKHILAVGGAIAAGVGGAIAVAAVRFTEFSQQGRMAFKMIAGPGEDAEETLRRVGDLAERFGLDLMQTTQAVKRFRAFGFDQGQAEDLVRLGADMRALGSSTDEVQRAFLAISQIKAAGKLQGDEINQLAEAGIPVSKVYEELAKQLGTSTEEVLRLKEAGKITDVQALKAIQDAMTGVTGLELGKAGEQAADGLLSGIFGKLRTKLQRKFTEIGGEIAPQLSETFGAIGDEITGFLDSAEGKQFISDIATGLKDAAAAVKEAIPFVKEFLGGFGEGAGDALKAVGDAFSVFTGGDGETTKSILKAVGKALGEIVVFALAVAVVFGGLVGVLITAATLIWGNMKAIGAAILSFVGNIVFSVISFFDDVGAIFDAEGLSMFEKAIAIGQAIVNGIINGITGLVGGLYTLARDVAGGIIDNFKNVFDSSSPSKVFEELGRFNMEGLAIGMTAEAPAVQGAAGHMQEAAVAGASASGGATSISFSPTIQVTAGAGATREDGERVGEGVVAVLEKRMLHFLDDAATEAGM